MSEKQTSPSQAVKAHLRYGENGTPRAPSYVSGLKAQSVIEADIDHQSPINANLSSNGLVQLSRSDGSLNIDDVDELASSLTTESEEEEHRLKSTSHKQQSSAQTWNEGSRTVSRVSDSSL